MSAARNHQRVSIVITGGGTGGHTYPALTTVRTLRAMLADRSVELDPVWVGTAAGLEARVAATEGIPFKALVTGKLRRSRAPRDLLRNLVDAFRIPVGLLQAVAFVVRRRPDVVFSTGGYVAVPIGVAAWLVRRPLVMHEQIVTLGLANRILARLATRILLSHESSLDVLPAGTRGRALVTGNPIRPELLTGSREAAVKQFQLVSDLPLVYVTGGALGSVQINDALAGALPGLLERSQVLHQCGSRSLERMRGVAAALPEELRQRYHVVEFVGAELPDVLAAADVTVSRSGAGTVAELTALGKASIFIPLVPTAGDEQRRNAMALVRVGAARALVGADVTPDRLRSEIVELLGDAELRARMADASRRLGRPQAASAVAAEIMAVAGVE